MKIRLLFFILLMVVSGAYAVSGFLVSNTGDLEGTGFWVVDNGSEDWHPARIDWEVTQNQDLTWHYDYSLSVNVADVSHFILETSQTFAEENVFNLSSPGTGFEIGSFTTQSGNPSMPATVYGMKFDSTSGTSINISFDSDRDPVWGDFYAKCGATGGTQNTVWNEGFATVDPLNPIQDGSIGNHILVPNTIPEPTTVVLFGLGSLLLRRKRSQDLFVF